MNYLVKINGDVINCNASDHDTICRKILGMKLNDFLYNKNGLRIMLHGETLAVEHYRPLSKIQNMIVKKMLKLNLIYNLSTVSGVKQSFRPIRSYND